MRRTLSLWVPVAAWCGGIFYLSSIPDLSTGLGLYDLILRKIAHFGEYAVLAALMRRALSGGSSLSPSALFWTAWGLSALYAAGDEWHQSFVPGRYASAADVSLDALGALAASLFLAWRSHAKLHRLPLVQHP